MVEIADSANEDIDARNDDGMALTLTRTELYKVRAALFEARDEPAADEMRDALPSPTRTTETATIRLSDYDWAAIAIKTEEYADAKAEKGAGASARRLAAIAYDIYMAVDTMYGQFYSAADGIRTKSAEGGLYAEA